MSLKRYFFAGLLTVLIAGLCASAQGGVGAEAFYPADMDPVLSPDGNAVAYVSQRGPTRADGSIIDPAASTRLYLRQLIPPGEERLTQTSPNLGRAAWTPDSQQLIFPATGLLGESNHGVALYRYDLPTRTLSRLTADDNSANNRPTVSPARLPNCRPSGTTVVHPASAPSSTSTAAPDTP